MAKESVIEQTKQELGIGQATETEAPAVKRTAKVKVIAKPKHGRITKFSVERTVQMRQYEPLRIAAEYQVGIDDDTAYILGMVKAFNDEVEAAFAPADTEPPAAITYPSPQPASTPAPANHNGFSQQQPDDAPTEKQQKRCYAIWVNDLQKDANCKPGFFKTVGEMNSWLKGVGKL